MHVGCSVESGMSFGKPVDCGHDKVNSLADIGIDILTASGSQESFGILIIQTYSVMSFLI
jgi:hypothetical protein